MKIAIVSDSHDNRALLRSAVEDACSRGAEAVLHCGDIVAPSTLSVLADLDIPVHAIHGNNTGDLYALSRVAERSGGRIRYYGQDAGIRLAERRIFIVHYPHYAMAMAATGDWDLVCCGHDHKAAVTLVTNVRGEQVPVVNPGSTGGVDAPATYVMGDLEQMAFEILDVPSTVAQQVLEL